MPLCLVISYIRIEAAQLTLNEEAYDFSDIGIVQSRSQYSLYALFNPIVSLPIISIRGTVRSVE